MLPENATTFDLVTILGGIGGVLIGWFIYTAFGGDGSRGIEWVRWLIASAWRATRHGRVAGHRRRRTESL